MSALALQIDADALAEDVRLYRLAVADAESAGYDVSDEDGEVCIVRQWSPYQGLVEYGRYELFEEATEALTALAGGEHPEAFS